MAINFDQNRDGINPSSGILTITSTGSITVPVGNTSQRPSTYKPGQLRFNTSTQTLEWADGTTWRALSGENISNASKTTYILTAPTPGLVVPGDTEEVLVFVSNSVERLNINENGAFLYGENLDKFTIDFTTGNTVIAGSVSASSAAVSDLTSGRVVLAGTDGEIEDSGNLTFDGTLLNVTGDVTLSGTLDVNTNATIATAKIEDLTAGRVVLAGTDGELQDIEQLTYTLNPVLDTDGVTVIDQTVLIRIDDNLSVGNQADLASAAVGDLTEDRIVIAGENGELEDDANLTFNGTQFAVGNNFSVNAATGEIIASNLNLGLTPGRLVIVSSDGSITDNSQMTYSITDIFDENGDFSDQVFTLTLEDSIDVNGQAVLASANIEDLTNGRVVLAGINGELEDHTYFTWADEVDENGDPTNGIEVSITGALFVDNVTIDGDTVYAQHVEIPDGGSATIPSLIVSSLTDGRVVLAGTDGELVDNTQLTYSIVDQLDTDGVTVIDQTFTLTVSDNIDVNGQALLSSARVEDLTSGRVVLAGVGGELEDDSNLTFDGTTLVVGTADANVQDDVNKFTVDVSTGATYINSTLQTADRATLSSAAISDLTSNRIVLVGADSKLIDDDSLTYTLTDVLDTDGVTVIDQAITVSINGQATFASAAVSDLTDNRIVIAGNNGELEDDANFTFDGTTLTLVSAASITGNTSITGEVDIIGDLDVDNININGNAITSTDTNGNINVTPDGTGEVVLATAAVSDLGTNNIVLTTTDSKLVDNDNFIYSVDTDGFVDVTLIGSFSIDNLNFNANDIISTNENGNINLTPNGTGEVVASTLTVSDLTSGRVVLAGTDGALVDAAQFTYTLTDVLDTDGVTVIDQTIVVTIEDDLSVGGNTSIGGTLAVTGESTLASATVSDLTDNRVVIAGTSGALEDDANFTFDGTTLIVGALDSNVQDDVNKFTIDVATGNTAIAGTLSAGETTVSSATVSDLTDNRIVIAGTSGALEDDANFTFDGTTFVIGTGDATADPVVPHKFTVDVATGNTELQGTLDVTNTARFDSNVYATKIIGRSLSNLLDLDYDEATDRGNSIFLESLQSIHLMLDSNNSEAGNYFGIYNNGSTVSSSDAIFRVDEDGAVVAAGSVTSTGSYVSSQLTDNRVLVAGTNGIIEDDANFTFDGTTLVVGTGDATADPVELDKFTVDVATGATYINSTLQTAGQATLSSAAVSDLTNDRIVIAGTAGELEDDANFTFDGTTFKVGTDTTDKFTVEVATGNTSIAGTLSVTGESTLASATVSDLTDNRIVIAGTTGSLEDDGNLTFDGTTFVIGTGDPTGDPAVPHKFTVDVSTGNTAIDGSLTVAGNTVLGDTDTADTVAFNSRVTTDFVPSTTNSNSLGTDSLSWKNLYLTSTLTYTGSSGENKIVIPDNVPGGLLITDGDTNYINFVTTNESESVAVTPNTSFANNVTITGNLTVSGTTTTVDSTTTQVVDPIITIGTAAGGADPTVDDDKDRGIAFKWYLDDNDPDTTPDSKIGFFGFDDSTQKFTFIPDATITNEVVSGTPGDVAFGSMTTGNISIGVGTDQNTITTSGTGLPLILQGDTEVIANSLTVSDLTNNRIVIAGTDGALEDDANFLFDGSNFIINPGDPLANPATNDAFNVEVSTGNITTTGTITTYYTDADGNQQTTLFATRNWVANDYTTLIAQPLWQVDDATVLTQAQAYADQAELDAIASANSYTDTAITDLIDGAPDDLNTLDKLAYAINDDADFFNTVLTKTGLSVADSATPASYGSTSGLSYDSTTATITLTTAVSIGAVNSTAPTDNQVLKYDTTNSEWVPGDVVGISSTVPTSAKDGDLWVDSDTVNLFVYSGGNWVPVVAGPTSSGGGTAVALSDISVTVAAAGTANLSYDNSTGVFTYTPPDLSTLATASDLTTLSNNLTTHISSLATVATTGAYSDLSGTPTLATVATSGDYTDLTNKPTNVQYTHQLLDVDTTNPANGQVLKWNSTSNLWEPAADNASTATGGVVGFEDLTVATQAASGSGALTYSGTGLSKGTFSYTPPDLSALATTASLSTVATTGEYSDLSNRPTIPTGIGSLSDVTISDPANNEFLKYDGTGWVNSTIPGGVQLDSFSVGADAAASGTGGLAYDNTTGTFTYTPPDFTSKIELTSLSVSETAASDGTDSSLAYDNTTGVFTYTLPYLTDFIKLDSLSVSNVNLDPDTTLVPAPSMVSGVKYIIIAAGSTNFTTYGASNNNVGTTFTAFNLGSGATGTGKVFPTDPTGSGTDNVAVSADSLTTGEEYIILTAGSTTWTDLGATDNTVGTIFTATGAQAPGPGLGTAYPTDRDTSVQPGLTYNNTSGVVTLAQKSYSVPGGTTNSNGTLVGVDLSTAIKILAQQIIDGDDAVKLLIPGDVADLTDNSSLLFTYVDLEDTPNDILPNFDNIDQGELLTVGSLTRTWDEGWFGKVVLATHGAQPSDTVKKALVLDSNGNLAQANDDGSNVETFSTFSGSYNDLTDKPSIPTDVGDLTDTGGTLGISLTSLSVGSDDPANGSGGLAYNNGTGVFTYTPPDLSGYSTFSGAYSDLTGTPTLFSGSYTDLTDKPTIPANINDLGDISIANPAAGQILKYDANNTQWYNASPSPDLSISTDSTASGGGALTFYATETTVDSVTYPAGTLRFTPAAIPTVPTVLTDLSITDGTSGQVLSTNGSGSFSFVDQSGGIALTDLSVGSNAAASGSGGLAYENTTGVFTYTPPDLSGYLSSYTETDPVVGAINGIVKANGSGTISAAVAGTDYSTFSGAYSDLTGKPTIPSSTSDLSNDSGFLTSVSWNDVSSKPSDIMLLGTSQNITADKRFNDNIELKFGSGNDASMYFNTTDMVLNLASGTSNFRIQDAGTNRFNFARSTGALTVTGDITAFGTISDIRQKENLQLIDGALQKVNQLNGYTFNYKTDPDTAMTGVVAQEVQKVLPEAVYETVNQANGEETLAVRHGNMVGVLIEAIKELTARVEYLEDKLKNGDS